MKSKFTFAAGLFLFVGIAAAIGAFFGNRLSHREASPELPIVLRADAASAGKSLSMATGIVDNDRNVEGLFVLDHLSGNLQCWLINPRNGSIAAIYAANANKDLELSKGGDADFVMVVGRFNAIGVQRGNNIPAGCVCYVGDGNTGKVVGYTFNFNKQLFNRNDLPVQNGPMTVLARGIARESGMRRDN